MSELLQAQLLQDININPVQPSLSETNLGIITGGGPARPGFNEFTPLFERNQAQLNAIGRVGNDEHAATRRWSPASTTGSRSAPGNSIFRQTAFGKTSA